MPGLDFSERKALRLHCIDLAIDWRWCRTRKHELKRVYLQIIGLSTNNVFNY
jgi:hypothetical protein